MTLMGGWEGFCCHVSVCSVSRDTNCPDVLDCLFKGGVQIWEERTALLSMTEGDVLQHKMFHSLSFPFFRCEVKQVILP